MTDVDDDSDLPADIERLRKYLVREADESFRGLILFDGDAVEHVVLRPDVRERRVRTEITTIVRRLRREATTAERESFPFGDLRATIRRFDEAVLLHLPQSEDRGVVVSLEPSVAPRLNSFIDGCLDRLVE